MSTATVTSHIGELLLPIDRLHESSTNPRKAFDQVQLVELAASIKTQGVLQPLLVRPNGKGHEIIDGARRWRAAKIVGLDKIPVVVREMTDQQVLEAQVIANLQRADLHPMEEADGYHKLLRGGMDAVRISEQIGRTAQYVRDRLKLLSLSRDAQRYFREGKILAGHAVILARLTPADQERAIEDGLFTDEQLLLRPDDDESDNADAVKAVSPRELQAWVDKHVRFDTADEHVAFLFPETAAAVVAATEVKEKIVRITHETMTPDEAKEGQKVILGRSWKRADGQQGSKTCERAITGVIDIGPGRGEAFKVCIDKKRCDVHWGQEIRDAKKREAAATQQGKTGEDRYRIQEEKRKEQEAVDNARRARWDKARPAILQALALEVRKAPARAKDALADLIVARIEAHNVRSKDVAGLIARGKTAEDLVRHAAFLIVASMTQGYWAWQEFPKQAKALFGLDVSKIVDQVAPKEPAAKAAPPAPEKKAPKSKAAKKSRGKRG